MAVAEFPTLNFLQRAIAGAERACHRALAALTKLQKERGFVPSKTERSAQPERPATQDAGFVPQKSPSHPAPVQPAAAQTGFVPSKSQPGPSRTQPDLARRHGS